ncbi:MAG: hypothetical protein EXS00_03565 [Phycisphaerales bacterium]|nr:hypothetical protein [Phycisphaerales bacterium]
MAEPNQPVAWKYQLCVTMIFLVLGAAVELGVVSWHLSQMQPTDTSVLTQETDLSRTHVWMVNRWSDRIVDWSCFWREPTALSNPMPASVLVSESDPPPRIDSGRQGGVRAARFSVGWPCRFEGTLWIATRTEDPFPAWAPDEVLIESVHASRTRFLDRERGGERWFSAPAFAADSAILGLMLATCFWLIRRISKQRHHKSDK